MCHLRMAVMHLPTKFCANSSIQFGVIDIFRNPRRRPPPSGIFKPCTFGTFHHVNSVVLELYIKFGSNICDSHWHHHTNAVDVHLMTSRELTSSFDFWSRAHLRMAVVHLPVAFPKKPKQENKKQWQTGYSPRPPTSPYRSQSLHAGWPPVCSSIFQVLL